MKKSFLCLLLSSVLITGTMPIAHAANLADSGHDANIAVQGTDALSIKSYTCETGIEGIMESADGYYAMEVDVVDGVAYIPVGRLDIDLLNPEQYTEALNSNDIPNPVK